MALMEKYIEPRESARELEQRFGIAQDSKPSEEQLAAQREIRDSIYYTAKILSTGVEDSREKSLALTALQEALMWAGKAFFK